MHYIFLNYSKFINIFLKIKTNNKYIIKYIIFIITVAPYLFLYLYLF